MDENVDIDNIAVWIDEIALGKSTMMLSTDATN